jgi:tetrahydromethanopterin S-methyltransferase subunit G
MKKNEKLVMTPEEVALIKKSLDNIEKSLDNIEKNLKSIREKTDFVLAGLREAQELFETVHASHSWTEKRNAWLKKYGVDSGQLS